MIEPAFILAYIYSTKTLDFLGEFLYNTKKLKRENGFKKM